jgi:hypothetical protein
MVLRALNPELDAQYANSSRRPNWAGGHSAAMLFAAVFFIRSEHRFRATRIGPAKGGLLLPADRPSSAAVVLESLGLLATRLTDTSHFQERFCVLLYGSLFR